MFERRLKIFLVLLAVVTTVLVARAAQLQIVKRAHWNEQALDALKRESLIDTTRGPLLDVQGNVIAQDVACMDACVDYRALTDPPDDKWVTSVARQWARTRRTDEWRAADAARRRQIITEEKKNVLERISAMWARLAEVGQREPEELDAARHDIIRRVEMARRYVWWRKYEAAKSEHGKRNAREAGDDSSWLGDWLMDDSAAAPEVDDFGMPVAEQTQAHPILRAVSSDVQNKLGKEMANFPGLSLQPGTTRQYPYGEVAAHVIGNLSRVKKEDLETDANAKDSLRRYQYTDQIGRRGLEALCEPLLRGARGRIERYMGDGDDKTLSSTAPAAGKPVRTTIDIALQQDVLALFQNADVVFPAPDPKDPPIRRTVAMHGGAVLIDVKTGEVRALVSSPTYDLNKFDAEYAELARDSLNRALMNRATQYPLETGSTIKPVVGLGAIAQGLVGVNEGIECTGYMIVGGKPYKHGRCWTASKFADLLGPAGVKHHPVPSHAPHRGHDGNADGFLTFSDALERSCNVYFETLGSRLGLDGLAYWMDQFGLGRVTGIGIEEARGRLPNSYDGPNPTFAAWSAGIGQGQISGTPLQMANVAATIARGGIWKRPTLLVHDDEQRLRTLLVAQDSAAHTTAPTTSPTTAPAAPPAQAWWQMRDTIDLKLPPAAVAAARKGMTDVVNSAGGTGNLLSMKDHNLLVAGKTGTAEAAKFRLTLLDADGKPQRDENGKFVRQTVAPSTVDHINPEAPWYVAYDSEGNNVKHAWIIGFAPANDPQVAFAVMVEYGGSGGVTAATIAKGMLDSAIQHGYLSPVRSQTTRIDGER